jgi:hypothetical protein
VICWQTTQAANGAVADSMRLESATERGLHPAARSGAFGAYRPLA